MTPITVILLIIIAVLAFALKRATDRINSYHTLNKALNELYIETRQERDGLQKELDGLR